MNSNTKPILKGILAAFTELFFSDNGDNKTEHTAGDHSFTLDLDNSLPVDPNDPSKGRWMS